MNIKAEQGNDKLKKADNKASSKKFQKIWSVVFKYRAVIISIPVVVVAIILGFQNAGRLPEQVGLELLSTGEFASRISRTTAVLMPMGITAGCVLLTCLSKRTLFPWLISVFSLVLPILIWLINVYPA